MTERRKDRQAGKKINGHTDMQIYRHRERHK